MRVMLPNGTVVIAEKVIAVSEQRLAFNGRVVRICEGATDIAYANGVAFFSEASIHGVASGDSILLGNLDNEFVREVLASLTHQGYADLSELKLQKVQLQTSDYVFDNGASGAYMIRGFEVNMSCGYSFIGGTGPAVNQAEDVEEAEEEDDDE